MPWKDPNDPVGVHRMDPDDPTNAGWNARRDTAKDPQREPGLVNPQRYQTGFQSLYGFPTYFGAPMAFTTDDLKAGKVDVAVVGMAAENHIIPGARLAANVMRTLPDWMTFGADSFGTDQYLRTEYLVDLVIADYGNIAAHYTNHQRTLEEIRTVLGEILAADAVPMTVGGTHIQMYGVLMALADKYGPGNFAMLHVDAHFDAWPSFQGNYVHSGSMVRGAIEKGIIKGEDVVQIGLRGLVPSAYDLQWIRDNKVRYHMMPEIERDGFDKVLKRVLKELKGKKVFISFDIDGIDPAYAPAVASQDIGGLTSIQAMRILRSVPIQNEVVAIEFTEYSPLFDDRHMSTGILVDRLMRTALAGIAARKKGITDPYYIHPESLDHGVR